MVSCSWRIHWMLLFWRYNNFFIFIICWKGLWLTGAYLLFSLLFETVERLLHCFSYPVFQTMVARAPALYIWGRPFWELSMARLKPAYLSRWLRLYGMGDIWRCKIPRINSFSTSNENTIVQRLRLGRIADFVIWTLKRNSETCIVACWHISCKYISSP
jgi:hypothetical protein